MLAGERLGRNSSLMGLSRARNYVYRLFKLRPRSEAELRLKLKNKGFTSEIVDTTIVYFKQQGSVNDRAFARFWITSRINRPLGLKRLFYELKQKGVAKDLASEVAEEFKSSIDEASIVKELAQKKFSRLKLKDKQKAKARIFAYLCRRGFSPDNIYQAIRQL